MTTEEFLSEVRKMVRPCLYLTGSPQDGPLAAVWKGPGLNGNLLSVNGSRLNLLQIAIGPRGEPALIGEEQKRILDHQTLLLR